MASLILVRNVVGELQPKRTLAASRGFLAAARLSCYESLQLTEMNYQKVTGDLHEKFRDSESYLLIANFRLSLRSLLFFVGRLSAVKLCD